MVRVQTFLFALAGLFAVLAAGLIWYVTMQLPQQRTGTEVALASIGGPFVLTDQDGHARGSRDFRDHFVLLYFGYTFCPDVCPTTLQDMATALSKLSTKSARVIPVFITIDPQRDTPAVLKKYVAAFGPRFVGLTGSVADVTRVAHAYRVYFAKQSVPGGGYSVDHSSILYLLGPDGKLMAIFDASAGAKALTDGLNARL